MRSLCNDVSTALSYMDNDSAVDVSLVPLGMKAAHDTVVKADDPQEEAEVPRANEDNDADEYLKTS